MDPVEAVEPLVTCRRVLVDVYIGINKLVLCITCKSSNLLIEANWNTRDINYSINTLHIAESPVRNKERCTTRGASPNPSCQKHVSILNSLTGLTLDPSCIDLRRCHSSSFVATERPWPEKHHQHPTGVLTSTPLSLPKSIVYQQPCQS